MDVGIVNWFGGVNKKTGKANNFGFLTIVKPEYGEQLYFNRKNVLTEEQHLLDSGVYVQFKIITDESGRKQATGVKPIAYVGIIDWFNNGRGYINCENISDVRIETSQSVKSGDVVFFFRKYNSVYRKNEAISPQIVETSSKNKLIIETCINSQIYKIYEPFIIDYALELPEKKSIKFVLNKIDKLDNQYKQEILNNLIIKSEKLFLASSELRQLLTSESNVSRYCDFFNKYLYLVQEDLKRELIKELFIRIKKTSNSLSSQYWNKIDFLKQNLQYKGCLWSIIPEHIKIELVKERYSTFFDLVLQFEQSDYPYSKGLSVSPKELKELYTFDDLDWDLIRSWCSQESGSNYEFNLAKMMSARGAEKLVFNFYKILGSSVEDTSAHQITGQTNIWKKGDVKLDSSILIDVKNARNTTNSNIYSEFCVPKFKQDRGSNVLITAVLSPYLQKKFMINPDNIYFKTIDPIILGSLDNETLLNLEYIFSNRFLSIDISRNSTSNRYLPPWLFDYNEKFYIKQHSLISKFRTILDSDIPDWEEIVITGARPLPLFITAKRNLPEKWQCHISSWKADFVKYLINITEESISLPYLLLGLLTHFLERLSKEDKTYSPKEYEDLIYTNFSRTEPLKIYDPLNIIKDFCNTLQTLWDNKETANLDQFTMFKFNGQGLLQGKRRQSDKFLTTILAYCGGWVNKKGKCGYSPLIVGKQNNCSVCGKLICPKDNCQFCSDDCENYLKRKDNQSLNTNFDYSNF